MKVNIYYGGRGMIDDPTLFVINKMQEVFDELKVKVERFDLYEMRNSITTLPQTLKEADAIILAATVEWYGIGGLLHEFLDACWLYGDKEKIASTYMFPVVMAKTYGEREAQSTIVNAWEILGGMAMNGLCAYINEDDGIEFNDDSIAIIEKTAENVYRAISQKAKVLPSSWAAVKRALIKETIQLTPQESEQLSKFVADDNFVAKQKQDIQELEGLFMELLDDEERGGDEYYVNSLKSHFIGKDGFDATYLLMISDKDRNVSITVNGRSIEVSVGGRKDADVVGKLNQSVFDDIVYGRMTFQRAFMAGEMTAKGNFRILRMLDEVFSF